MAREQDQRNPAEQGERIDRGGGMGNEERVPSGGAEDIRGIADDEDDEFEDADADDLEDEEEDEGDEGAF